jgi:hypothetical protein
MCKNVLHAVQCMDTLVMTWRRWGTEWWRLVVKRLHSHVLVGTFEMLALPNRILYKLCKWFWF